MKEPRAILEKLGLNDSEVDVYLAMQGGTRRVADIMRITGRKRPTVYYAIDCLEKRGLVSKTGSKSESVRVEPPSRLASIAIKMREESENLAQDAESLAASFSPKKSEHPEVAFFEGVEAVRMTVMEALYCKDKTIDVVAPHDNFFQQMGTAFVKEHIELRTKRGIRTRSLWERATEPALFKKYYAGRSDVGLLPKVMRGKFASTVMLYDDKTLYISSKGNAYCVLVTSKEHHDTMRAWFDGLWDASTPHPRA